MEKVYSNCCGANIYKMLIMAYLKWGKKQEVREFSADMSWFPTNKHISKWAGLRPGNNESIGKRKSGKLWKEKWTSIRTDNVIEHLSWDICRCT